MGGHSCTIIGPCVGGWRAWSWWWAAAPADSAYNVCYVNGFQTQPDEARFWRRHRPLILRHHGHAWC